ncbi:MAG: tetratricopeptide repeat protein [Pseudomonadales bacterium]
MSGYTTREVAELVGLTVDQIRHYIRRGLIAPGRGARGEYRFEFQDMVLLRTASGLRDAAVSPRRAFAALEKLRADLGDADSLASLRILGDGGRVVVRDDAALWEVQTGQGLLDFSVRDLAGEVAELRRRRRAGPEADEDPADGDSDTYYNLAVDLEDVDPGRSAEAYRRALELDPSNVDAHVNLGRLLQLESSPEAAGEHYRMALAQVPDHQLALFNLGTLYDELDDFEAAVACYLQAPEVADAHYNLCRIFEIRGDEVAALRHLRRYRQILQA